VKISGMDGVDFSLFLVFQRLKTGQPGRLTLFFVSIFDRNETLRRFWNS